MKNLTIPSLAALAMAFSGGAIAADERYDAKTTIKQNDDGSYERKVSEESKDATGTLRSKEVTTEVDVGADGDKETTIKSKSVEDPKGLMNKTTVETESKTTLEDGKESTSYEKKINGKVVDESEE